MFINQDITNQLTSVLDGFKYEVYSKQIRENIKQTINEVLLPVADQYDLSKLILRVNYYYEDNRLNIIMDLNDQHFELNVLLTKLIEEN